MSTFHLRLSLAALTAAILSTATTTRASAEAMLLIEASTGRVLHAENATTPWYPASITKVMTAYVALHAVKERRLSLDNLLTVSARAAAQAPSKMGFKAGATVTVDNALKMLMVKSANDVAVVIAEGVSGSVEKFAAEMNAASRRLGMTQSSWVNPNGLPADDQISSARDLAILARAMLTEFPEYNSYWSIPAIKFGKKVMRNHNSLIGRYPGADGMKTGFICASGFNLVASATRNGKRLIVVVLGSPSSPVRGAKAAGLLERGFSGNALSWLRPSLGTVEQLQVVSASPPDLRENMCGKHRKRPAAEEADDDDDNAVAANQADPNSPVAFMLSSLPPANGKISQLIAPPGPVNPIVVHTGPAKKSAETRIAAERTKLEAKDVKIAGKKDLKNKKVASADPAGPAATGATRGVEASAQGTLLPPPGAVPTLPPSQFGPPTGQFTPSSGRTMPLANAWMSFAPAAQAASTPPLTAAPAATDSKVAAVPMPRPRPKQSAPAR